VEANLDATTPATADREEVQAVLPREGRGDGPGRAREGRGGGAPSAAEAAAPTPAGPKHQTRQPWKKTATNTHGFGKTSLPRKVGGS